MTTVYGVAQPLPRPELGRPIRLVVDRRGILRKTMSGLRDSGAFECEIRDDL